MINLPLHNKIQDVLFNRRKIVHSENVSRRIDLGINDNDQIIFFYTNYIEILYHTYLISFVLQYWNFEKLSVLNSDTAKCQVTLKNFGVVIRKLRRMVCFINNLGHSDNVSIVVTDRHTENDIGFVTSPEVNFVVETWILQ